MADTPGRSDTEGTKRRPVHVRPARRHRSDTTDDEIGMVAPRQVERSKKKPRKAKRASKTEQPADRMDADRKPSARRRLRSSLPAMPPTGTKVHVCWMHRIQAPDDASSRSTTHASNCLRQRAGPPVVHLHREHSEWSAPARDPVKRRVNLWLIGREGLLSPCQAPAHTVVHGSSDW